MNKVILIGRTTKDIEVRYTTGENPTAVARFTMAVDRYGKDDKADFISCVAFGKMAETMERYVPKGRKIGVIGRIQTGSYEKDDRKVYTTDVVIEQMEFCEPKRESNEPVGDGFEDMRTDDIPY